ncbi:hypothetical protein [Sporomusa sp.]|uniref:hypothetical protein n=1 Tax=Sporomusa sp. TaxID=2078658 RepID=UPI002BECAD87|nr:hypothetical protein [Sporomusa sp.]HWR41972.1 hypothetical protein [Sporomusa sp.]
MNDEAGCSLDPDGFFPVRFNKAAILRKSYQQFLVKLNTQTPLLFEIEVNNEMGNVCGQAGDGLLWLASWETGIVALEQKFV